MRCSVYVTGFGLRNSLERHYFWESLEKTLVGRAYTWVTLTQTPSFTFHMYTNPYKNISAHIVMKLNQYLVKIIMITLIASWLTSSSSSLVILLPGAGSWATRVLGEVRLTPAATALSSAFLLRYNFVCGKHLSFTFSFDINVIYLHFRFNMICQQISEENSLF